MSLIYRRERAVVGSGDEEEVSNVAMIRLTRWVIYLVKGNELEGDEDQWGGSRKNAGLCLCGNVSVG